MPSGLPLATGALVFWATIVVAQGWRAALVVVLAVVLALATAVLMSAGNEG